MFFLFFELTALFFYFFVGDALTRVGVTVKLHGYRGTYKVGEGVAVLFAADDVDGLWVGHDMGEV